MGPCLTPSTIRALRAGTLAPDLRAGVETHVRSCDTCRRRVESSPGNGGSLSDSAEELPPTVPLSTSATSGSASPVAPKFPAVPAGGFPGYEVLSEIRRGGQGIVYKARQIPTGRTVALKVLLHGASATPDQRARFQREIAVVARLRHPHIVTIYDSGVVDDLAFYAMEHVEGVALDVWIAGRILSIDDRVRLLASVCAAVGYAHGQGVVHRDLKPGNLLVDERGEPHVLDFGLAKVTGVDAIGFEQRYSQSGEFLGTLPYASPEQARGDRDAIDVRTDVYSLGVILYEAVTGRRPYDLGPDLRSALQAIIETEPTRPSTVSRQIDDELETIILKALAKDASRRYPSAAEMADDLVRYLDGSPILAKRDSFTYLMRKRISRVVSHHSATAGVFAVAIAAVAGHTVYTFGGSLRVADRWFDSFVQPFARHGSRAGLSDDLVVIAFDDTTLAAIPQLASRAGLEGVSIENPPSWRRLHGAFLERLAAAHPKVVAWDFAFVGDQPEHDTVFAKGIDAFRASGSRLVVSIDTVDQNGRPVMSRAVAERADGWGWLYLARTDSTNVVTGSTLVVKHGMLAPTPSLALATFAIARHPDCVPAYEWLANPTFQAFDVLYHPRALDGRVSDVPLDEIDRIAFANLKDNWRVGLPPDVSCKDRGVACSLNSVPSRDELARRTLSYSKVFDLDPLDLQSRLDGKVLLVGDTIASHGDVAELDDGGVTPGRREFSCFMHAAAISDLLREFSLTRPGAGLFVLLLLASGVTGLVVGESCSRRSPVVSVPLAVLGWIVVVVAIGVAVAATFESVISPTCLIVSFGVALIAGLLIAREAASHPVRTRSTDLIASPAVRPT